MIISEKNVKKAKFFDFSELEMSPSEISRLEEKFKSPKDFLIHIRLSNSDKLKGIEREAYERLYELGYIRTDKLFLTMSLFKLYDAVFPDRHSRYVYINKNMQYEDIMAMTEEVTSRITDFIWHFKGNGRVRRFTNYEQQILFDYFGISNKLDVEMTLGQIARSYYIEKPEPEECAQHCLDSAIGKLRNLGDEFASLFVYDESEVAKTIEARKAELKELLDPEREMRIRNLARGLDSECRRLDLPTVFDYVDIEFVILDRNLRKKLKENNILTLDDLIKAFADRRIEKIYSYETHEYKIIKSCAKNFFYRYHIIMPECIR